jgi:hypothetical protein
LCNSPGGKLVRCRSTVCSCIISLIL